MKSEGLDRNMGAATIDWKLDSVMNIHCHLQFTIRTTIKNPNPFNTFVYTRYQILFYKIPKKFNN